jgi:hypothetical protein
MPGPSEPADRARPALALLAAGLIGAVACGGARTATDEGRAVLTITCPVRDAVVWVDGRYVAQVRDLAGGLALAPGRHQIELRHERYHATYREVEVARGQRLRIDLALAEAFP